MVSQHIRSLWPSARRAKSLSSPSAALCRSSSAFSAAPASAPAAAAPRESSLDPGRLRNVAAIARVGPGRTRLSGLLRERERRSPSASEVVRLINREFVSMAASGSPSTGPTIQNISTLVLGEIENGSLKPSCLSAIEAAKSLSKENSISLLLAGSGPSLKEATKMASSYGSLLSQVLVADSDIFANPLAEPWAKLIQMVHQSGAYSHVIATSSSFGKNILPRVAALLDVSPITDVVRISDSNLFVRPIYAGNALCTVRHTGPGPCLLTIRSTSFPVESTVGDSVPNEAPISHVDLSTFSQESKGKSRYIKLSSQDTERPDLGNARVVITGGRGLKNADNFKMIEKLAEKLGAAVGATRAAVDAGFVPNDLQVGQTGKIVAPDLYMAFGVSGAIQHLAGMKDSKVIVAVNKDADAPIFQVADYGLVGDLFEVIPELLEKLPEKK